MNKTDFKRFIKDMPKVEFYKYISPTEKVLRIGYKWDFIDYTFYIEDNQEVTDSNGFNMGSLYKGSKLKEMKKNIILYYEVYVENMKKALEKFNEEKKEETKNDVQIQE